MNEDFKNLPNTLFIFAIVALLAGIFVILLNELQISQDLDVTETNETTTIVALDTAQDVNAASVTYFVEVQNATVTVQNSTLGGITESGNWTIQETDGTITVLTGGVIAAGSVVNITYTYTLGGDSRDTFQDGITGLLEITSWLDLIGLIVAASIIMYLVLRNFGILGGDKGSQGQVY